MSDANIPNFKTTEEVLKWAHKLTAEEIKSWSIKDWLKVYKKLAILDAQKKEVARNREIQLLKRVKEYIGLGDVAEVTDKFGEIIRQKFNEDEKISIVLKEQSAKSKGKVLVKSSEYTVKKKILTANKAYDEFFDKVMNWGDKHAPQWMNKVEEATVQRAAENFMKTKSGQVIAREIKKKIGKDVAISISKKIPGLCVLIGAGLVYDRLKEGEYLKAVGEGASAILANVPGLGTLASFGIDGAMLSDDLKVFEHGVLKGDPNSHVAAESTFVERPEIRQAKLVRKVDKAEEEKNAKKFKDNLNRYGAMKSATDFFERG